MTPGRRSLRFACLGEVMSDVQRLRQGHTTVGNWTLAQICHHLAGALRLTADLPATTPQDPTLWVDKGLKRWVFESGQLLEGYAAPPAILPDAARCEESEADGLQEAIAHYKVTGGPVIPHLYLGPLSKAEWDRFHLIHCAHHLSLAVPTRRL